MVGSFFWAVYMVFWGLLWCGRWLLYYSWGCYGVECGCYGVLGVAMVWKVVAMVICVVSFAGLISVL